MQKEFTFRKIQPSDQAQIFSLYKKSAAVKEGLARTPEEITQKYISDLVKNSCENGLGIVVLDQEKIIASLTGHKLEAKAFSPTMTNLTLAVDPDYFGNSLGKKTFKKFTTEIQENHPEIHRIELNVRQNNQLAIKIYESVGFVTECVLKNRLLNYKNEISDDTMMAWYRK